MAALKNLTGMKFNSLTVVKRGLRPENSKDAQGTSKGEEAINNILIENNIAFKREFSFDDFPGFKFDFFVNNQFIIEFDGTQHYIEKGHFKKSFKDIVNRDIKKNRYCLDNNIKLYRIPYEYRDKLTLEMLTLDKFRVKKEDHYKLLSEVD